MNSAIFNIDKKRLFELEDKYRDVFHKPLMVFLKNVVVASLFIGITIFSLWKTGLFDLKTIAGGLTRLGMVLSFMIPPKVSPEIFRFIYAIFETLSMAFLGTLLAALFSIPLGFIGAKNIVSNPLIHFVTRRIFDFIRGISELVWALVFIGVVGLGPFAGILAIALADIGSLSKLYAESIENIEKKQVDSVRSTGSNKLQTFRFGIIPQISPVILGNALYYFESNTRSASILGIVGAGGIGLILSDRIRINEWQEVSTVIILIIITVMIIDFVSKKIRHKFINS
jgi:phosphonate transport system permease protein